MKYKKETQEKNFKRGKKRIGLKLATGLRAGGMNLEVGDMFAAWGDDFDGTDSWAFGIVGNLDDRTATDGYKYIIMQK